MQFHDVRIPDWDSLSGKEQNAVPYLLSVAVTEIQQCPAMDVEVLVFGRGLHQKLIAEMPKAGLPPSDYVADYIVNQAMKRTGRFWKYPEGTIWRRN